MIDIGMLGTAAFGFVIGAPSGALLLGAMRWALRSDPDKNSDRESKGRPRPTPRVALQAVETSDPAARKIDTACSNSLVGRRLPARRPRTVDEHSLELARWVLEDIPGGLRGRTITAIELIEVYSEMCGEIGCEPRGWQPTAVQFSRLLGIEKLYSTIEGRRVRTYSLPNRSLDEILAERAAATARKTTTNSTRKPAVAAPALAAA